MNRERPKFPPGYGYPSREDWEWKTMQNFRAPLWERFKRSQLFGYLGASLEVGGFLALGLVIFYTLLQGSTR